MGMSACLCCEVEVDQDRPAGLAPWLICTRLRACSTLRRGFVPVGTGAGEPAWTLVACAWH